MTTSSVGTHTFSVHATALAALVGALPAAAEADPTAPQIELVTPADGAAFYQGQQVQAGYACFAGTLGWPVTTCQGDVPLGDYFDTSSAGTHTFSVHAVDYAGAETTVTHTYTVFDVIPPTATITMPAADAAYPVGAQLYASYSCDDGPGGSGVIGCIGTYPNGYPLPTSQRGTFTFTVDAFDMGGNHGSTTLTYRIVDQTAPRITINSPADGAVYHVGATITPLFVCHDDVRSTRPRGRTRSASTRSTRRGTPPRRRRRIRSATTSTASTRRSSTSRRA